jgi:uncharacterized membrane protein YbhN (UPF0104 family)
MNHIAAPVGRPRFARLIGVPLAIAACALLCFALLGIRLGGINEPRIIAAAIGESIGALVLAFVAMGIFARAWSLRRTGLRPTLETGRPEGN